MPRHKQSEREQIQSTTRQALLQAATRAFAEHGYANASVDAISTEAGFAKGTIYNYFASKRKLMLALIETISSDHYASVLMEVQEVDDPEQRLERFYKAGFEWVASNPNQARDLITTLNGADQEFKGAMYAAYEPMFQLVRLEILAPGIEAGVFRPVDQPPTAGLLMATYLGTCSQVDEHGRPWIDPKQVANFALHALRPSRPQT
jgi:AcrR family transcriptional regulator